MDKKVFWEGEEIDLDKLPPRPLPDKKQMAAVIANDNAINERQPK